KLYVVSIYNNKATGTGGMGGGVYVVTSGTFTMYGGTISGNTATNGGGVYVNDYGTFTMKDGTISGNTATTSGGGVYFSEGTFTMSGGTIAGNTAGDEGGGVRLFDTATLNGKVNITGNKKSDEVSDNLFLSSGNTITIETGFSTDSMIGVTTKTAPTDCSSGTVAVTGEVTTDISGSFIPDVDGQAVVYKDKTVQLALHSYGDEWSSDDTNHWQECTSCGDKTDEAEHTFADKSDETNHWQECSECGYKKDITEHSWGDWSLTTEPTLTTTGEAERECSFGEKQTKTDVPVLTDTTVWTKGNRTDPTLNGAGSEEYTSEYGTVTITIPALTDTTVWTKVDDKHIEPTEETDGKDVYTSTDYGEVTVILPSLEHTHEWGEWAITTKPTLTTTGTAERVCTKNDTHIDTTTLPVLTDTSVWTKDDTKHVEPTEETDGEDVYTSEYGEVTVVLTSLGHTHKWGEWTITTEPTLTTMGAAERECSCGETQIKTDVPALTDTSVWTKDDTKHVEPTEETDGRDVYTSEYGEVTVVLTSLGHTHKWGGWTITIEPTLTATGAAHRVCTENDTHIDTITLPALTDTSVWTKVDDKHVDPTEDTDGRDVYTSEYGEVTVVLDKSSHTHKFPLTYVPEVKPTEDKEGVKEHWHCDDCGKDFADENGTKEVTADDLRIGKIQTEVQAPVNVEIATPIEELITAALTEEEQQKITEGTDIKIILKVENVTESVPAEDKGKVETEINGLSDYKLGQYLDITLLKKIGEEQEQKITMTNAPIKITFEIPEGLRGKAEYSVIRVHGGTATVLRDLDSDPNTVTIETDKFSTYALTYKEKTTTSNPSGGNSNGGNSGGSRPSGGNSGGSSNTSTSTPTESDNSDDISSDDDIPSSDDNSDITSGESEPTEEDNSDAASSDDGSITSGDDGGAVSSDDSDTKSSDTDTSNDGVSSSDENLHAVSETGSSENNGNPSTGIAVSLIPLVTAAAILTVAIKLKKK
ncbi:MAG: hypothetical protein K2O14_08670, partial [Oscillospiraceae bacterium]|nr:hypothetical protein [Oscillospiraceae bacterium]